VIKFIVEFYFLLVRFTGNPQKVMCSNCPTLELAAATEVTHCNDDDDDDDDDDGKTER